MATPAFGAVLEAALKDDVQGGRFTATLAETVDPKFFCCVSGTSVGVAKDPVALMAVSATRLCTGDAITVDYSGSWSPSSTIAGWEVNWGDGNTSSGAFPGAGSVAHPLGGYTLPGTYTITLTVTDLLGYTGTQSVTVEAIDCDAIEIDLFAGCGASGVWATTTAGASWSQVGLEEIGSPQIYDLKASVFTIGLEEVLLWTATESGLYKSENSGLSFSLHPLPIPPTASTVHPPVAYAVQPSKYDIDEVYVLANWTDTNGTSRISVYRSIDGGDTWEYTTFNSIYLPDSTVIDWTGMGQINFDNIYEMALGPGDGYIYVVGDLDDGVTTWQCGYWNPADSTWTFFSNAGLTIGAWGAQCIAFGRDGTLYIGGELSGGPTHGSVFSWNGVAWTQVGGDIQAVVYDIAFDSGGTMYAGTNAAGGDPAPANNDAVWVFTGGAWMGIGEVLEARPLTTVWCISISFDGDDNLYASGMWSEIGGVSAPMCAMYDGAWHSIGSQWTADNGTLASIYDPLRQVFWAGEWTAATTNIGGWDGNSWSMYVDAMDDVRRFRIIGNTLFAVGGSSSVGRVIAMNLDRPSDGFTRITGANNFIFDVLITGSEQFDNLRYYVSGDFNNVGGGAGGEYMIAWGEPVAWLGLNSTAYGQTIDMSADGQFVFVCLVNTWSELVLVRVEYDLSYYIDSKYTGGGSWGGVVCDPWYGSIVWAYGDWSNLDKVSRSEDWGQSFTVIASGGFGHPETVRPLLISDWDDRDLIAVLNTALEVWRTYDTGTTWDDIGTPAFTAQSGARDPYEPENVWIGREGAGANHLQYSPNGGVDWQEASGGITVNAPVSAIVVTG
jgi:hypothetical protein